MKLYVLSDLHILGSADAMYARLVGWLDRVPVRDDLVVLAGDIFDLYVGDKPSFAREYRAFFESLRRASARGVFLHYISGNHDFEHAGAFRSIPGMQFDPDRFSFTFGGKRILVEHGDLADRKDLGYRALRFVLRSPPMKAVIRLAPDGLVQAIGGRMRSWSEGKREERGYAPRARDLERLRAVYRSYAVDRMGEGYDFVVLGHCHDLDEMSFQVAGRATHYMNVGFPPAHGSIVTWSPGDARLSREEFPAHGDSAVALRS